jgi:two-component system sensor histidine kinase UhpB
MSLFWRVLAANAAILIAGTLVLLFAPGPLHKHTADLDVAALLIGLLIMVAVNGTLLRRLFVPLERLARRMQTADVLRGSQPVPIEGAGEIGTLGRAFNGMMERLEAERREAVTRALEAREEERRRLARGLHDEVGQSMTAVLLQLRGLIADALPEQRERLAEAQNVVKTSLAEVRRLAQELRPELLDHLGLSSAITNLASDFERDSQVRVRREIARNLPPLDPRVELVVYRVAQESMTNVARHANASEVLVSLESANGSVVLRVVDNGRGFPQEHVEAGGLRGIRERALIANAAVAIKPGPDGGVEVRLEVPTSTV